VPDAEEALHLARDIGEPKALAQTLLFLGSLLQWRAEFDRSLAYFHEGVELAQRVHAGHLLGHAAFTIGNASAAQGAYEEALQWYQQLSDYTSTAGDTYWLPRIPNTIGGVHFELFDLDEALRLNLEADEVAQQLFSWPEPRGHSLVKAGLVYLRQDEHSRAEAAFRRAEALLEADAWMRWRWHIALLYALGELALTQGHYDAAWTYATQSLELATQTDSRKHVVRVPSGCKETFWRQAGDSRKRRRR
jgi:tetratricopeptide (TPR) repeat protein